MEIMAEDWVRLQLEMRLQLGVLRHTGLEKSRVSLGGGGGGMELFTCLYV